MRSRGVKKAPFVVLIGAAMPSVLAEISFITNRQELQLLKTAAYKDKIAQALYAAVLRYRKSLKGAAVDDGRALTLTSARNRLCWWPRASMIVMARRERYQM